MPSLTILWKNQKKYEKELSVFKKNPNINEADRDMLWAGVHIAYYLIKPKQNPFLLYD